MSPESDGKAMRTWEPMGCGVAVSTNIPPSEMLRAIPIPQPCSPSSQTGNTLSSRDPERRSDGRAAGVSTVSDARRNQDMNEKASAEKATAEAPCRQTSDLHLHTPTGYFL